MTILLAPVATTTATQIAPQLWRKQLLKTGEIDYNGRKLKFDKAYYDKITRSFMEKAYDGVPFVLADRENRHTMDPERTRGEVVGLEADDQGLYGILRLSTDAAKIVAEYPRFGVSVRIVEQLERPDGYRAPAALQHVLGTWDGKVTGLSPWEAVEMSNVDGHQTIDLTKEGGAVPLTDEQAARLAPLASLTDEQIQALVAAAAPPKPEDDDEDGTELTDEEALAIIERMVNGAPEDEDEEEDETVAASLSSPTDEDRQRDIALAQVREENLQIRAELATARWQAERQRYQAAGVPPAHLDLAAPLLSLHQTPAIELSNGTRLDPAGIVRGLLDAAKGTIDLSEELGHSDSGGDPDDNSDLHKLADEAGFGVRH